MSCLASFHGLEDCHFVLSHEGELAHSDQRPGQQGRVLVADIVGIVALVEGLTHLHEAGEQRNERSSAVILGDSRPVAGRQLHGAPEPLDPDPDHIVISPFA